LLSICIPTYDRCKFLQWTINRLLDDFPATPIYVSDNASNDGTWWLCCDGPIAWPNSIGYIRQPTNIGPFPNMREALLGPTTKYVVYCADDDYLLPGGVERGLQYLDAHPECVAYYAPCELYDEVAQEPSWRAYQLPEAKTFSDPIDLFNFVISYHVWPEHAIWRREGLEAILEPRQRAYWAFLDLGRAKARGTVHFAPEPFYRNLTAHPLGHREKLGDQQCLTDFEEYRAGLEIMAHDLLSQHSGPPWPQAMRRQVQQMIDHFIYLRLEVAHRIHGACGREAEARTMAKRMAVCNPYLG
jgi:glycosyltransferase involved in cell wall biosynthesis